MASLRQLRRIAAEAFACLDESRHDARRDLIVAPLDDDAVRQLGGHARHDDRARVQAEPGRWMRLLDGLRAVHRIMQGEVFALEVRDLLRVEELLDMQVLPEQGHPLTGGLGNGIPHCV